jgi:hypothetical protein
MRIVGFSEVESENVATCDDCDRVGIHLTMTSDVRTTAKAPYGLETYKPFFNPELKRRPRILPYYCAYDHSVFASELRLTKDSMNEVDHPRTSQRRLYERAFNNPKQDMPLDD